jgi:long-chain acyl-CoA synthetase
MSLARPWLAHYPEGVPHEIVLGGNQSLVDLFENAFQSYPDRTACVFMGKGLTYRQLDLLSQNFAAYLQTLKLETGSRVAIMLPNTPSYLVAMLATLRAGLVVVNINPLYTSSELEHQLRDSGASVLVLLENFAHVYEVIADQGIVQKVIIASIGDLLGLKGKIINALARHVKKMVPAWHFDRITFPKAIEMGGQRPYKRPVIQTTDIAFLQYTGGTTGVSKGAVLLHQNLLANVMQIEVWLEPALQGKQEEQLVFICPLPMTHIFALTACALLGMRKGGKLILIANPRDISGFISTLQKHPDIHIFPGVNTLFHALIHHPDFKKIKLSNLLVTIGGGMAVQRKTAELWHQSTGVPIAQGYGLSETSPVVCVNTPLVTTFTGSIGMPLPSTDIMIADDDGNSLPFGSSGEIYIKGPQVMAGYWQQANETNQVITADGYFKSGDIGFMQSDGHIHIVDRKKDMIVVAGFKVFPNEIEDIIVTMPGVLECAVIGHSHRKLGEIVTVYIVKIHSDLQELDVIQFCKGKMSSYKRPRKVIFMNELPKSNVGKILRRQLRDL